MYKIKGLEKYRRHIPALNNGQFKAIHDSLAKWQFLSWHPNEWHDIPNCKCCEYRDELYKDCNVCPVDKITKNGCDGTPWQLWSDLFILNGRYDAAQEKAEDEYHFLEGIYSIELHRRMGL